MCETLNLYLTKWINWINQHIDENEFNRYGLLPITLTAGSCLASIACYFILKYDGSMFELALCAASAMGANAIAIALAPMRWYIWSFLVSVVISIALILANLG